ncbi:MAG: thiosulfate sulfurtransferase GlpE [Elusimicrobiota bacterium]
MRDVEQIEFARARELLASGCAFVDVRDDASYNSAHIPGAIHLTDANVGDFIAVSDKAKPVVVYCYHGHSSLGGAAYLMEHGFEKVYSLAGGFESWRRSAAA